MKRTRMQIMLITVTVLALGAGVVTGLLASRLPAPIANPAEISCPVTPAQLSLADELQLSTDQRDQMRGIWESVRSKVENTSSDAQDLQRQRDQALIALLNDEQKIRYEMITKEFAGKFDELSQKREKTFADAVEKTKKILDATQREKYEQILASRVGRAPTTAPAPAVKH